MSRILLKFPKLFLKYIISSNVDECQKSYKKMLKNLGIWYGKKYLIFMFHPSTIHITSSQVLFSGLTIKTKSQWHACQLVVNFSKTKLNLMLSTLLYHLSTLNYRKLPKNFKLCIHMVCISIVRSYDCETCKY